MNSARATKLKLWPLAMSIFFVVSGGPYAMETLVSSSGRGIALLLILVTPIVWSMPAALMTAELASAIPEEGGFYVWTKRALGPLGGFLCGWWSWIYFWVDVSLYPGLFAGYLVALIKTMHGGHFSGFSPWVQYLIGISILLPIMWLNIRGIEISGIANLCLAVLLLSPFLILILIGCGRFGGHIGAAFHTLAPAGKTVSQGVAAGSFVILWNYLGWDSLSTVCGETDRPARNFPRALGWAMIITVAVYFLPFLFGVLAVPDPSKWTQGAWPDIASAIGGNWLGILVAVGALLSTLGLCNATLLSASRLPFVFAQDRFLPKPLTRVHPRYGTPFAAIIVTGIIAAILAVQSFDVLIKIDVLVYSAGLLLEFAALLVLRYKEPKLARPYRIPGGLAAVWILVLIPAALVGAAFFITLKSDAKAQIITFCALATGPLLYLCGIIFRQLFQGPPNETNLPAQ